VLDPVEHVVDGRPLGEALQFGGKVLLQGLAPLLGAEHQSGMDVVGEVANEHAGHACIVLSNRDIFKALGEIQMAGPARLAAPPQGRA
jgi:hypothetical protein